MEFTLPIGPNVRKSPFFAATVAAGVKSFSVYNHMLLPGHYGDPEGEYDRLVNGVAIWDVGAERQVEIAGPDAGAMVQYLTPRDLSGQEVGQGLYVPLCDHDGWLINDPVCLKLAEDRYWLSVADSDVWLWAKAVGRERGMDVAVFEPDASPLAVQGPKAEDVIAVLFGEEVRDIGKFRFERRDLGDIPLILARSGWSKQGGFEIYLMDGARGNELWDRVVEAGRPFGIGPGAPNDAERIEGGLISLGSDIRHAERPANPFEMGLEKLVSLDRHEFIGRKALRRVAAEGARRRRTGVFIEGGTVEPNTHALDLMQDEKVVGLISEVVQSPRLGRAIGVGLVSTEVDESAEGLWIHLGGERRVITLTDLPFL